MTITICWGLLFEIARIVLEILGVILVILATISVRREYQRKQHLGRIVRNALNQGKKNQTKKEGK